LSEQQLIVKVEVSKEISDKGVGIIFILKDLQKELL